MNAFVARQPIFDRKRNVYGYELLFRDGIRHALDLADGTAATSQVMTHSVLVFGLRALTGGTKAFINVTRPVLLQGHVHLLPTDLVIPEILPDVSPEPDVLEACRGLKEAGFTLALDGAGSKDSGPLVEMADLVKVDFRETSEDRQRDLAARRPHAGVRLVAKKIEEAAEFTRAAELGYDYFQGFFFANPEILSRRQIPASQRQYLDLLREINRPSIALEDLHDVIKRDVSLVHRLLRYLNSVHFGLRARVRSIRHALTLLGTRNVKKWATLISLACMNQRKPGELLVSALTRARFCETLAPLVGLEEEAEDLFLLGLLSLLDAVVDQPLEVCLADMPVTEKIIAPLLGEPGPYRDILDLERHYQLGAWEHLAETAKRLNLSESSIPDVHLAALRWSRGAASAGSAG